MCKVAVCKFCGFFCRLQKNIKKMVGSPLRKRPLRVFSAAQVGASGIIA